MRCPNCGNAPRTIVVSETRRNLYTFRKYNCGFCDKSFHTHEYLQDTRNEPALKARLAGIRAKMNETRKQLDLAGRMLVQLELEIN